ncbi:hypothetical protein [Mucilaginibacter polytrichastri]|uniref:Uncharacterized protein n=1 Tax=Mucilaginibacter polytrichastri TaxID=1302689 RepID=A0A1Q6A2J5_9SPHI|nr:hypothetical protein [Mucilaginibacter polytrichastri]OKS88192.1 hypothetical protein RG47T_3656 [Mucilaginibacter polytrichastri]SFT08622.1 hypothetical protein SAMN04487890_11045 [Mucilaginibacter polytrichastri]
MNKKTILSDVANVLSILKGLPELLKQVYPHVLTWGGLLFAYISYHANLTNTVVLSAICITVVGGITFVFKDRIRRALTVLRKSKKLVRPEQFSTIYNEVVIDIASNRRKAKLTQKRFVQCLVANVLYYQYRFYPAYKYTNIQHNVGKRIIDPNKDDAVDVLIEFNKPLKVKSKALFELSCDMLDVFPTADEYWCLSQFYRIDGPYKLKILFPASSFPTWYKGEIIENDDFDNPIPVDVFSNHQRRRKPSLNMDVTLKEGQDLYLRFVW